jgi:hypothetical protein
VSAAGRTTVDDSGSSGLWQNRSAPVLVRRADRSEAPDPPERSDPTPRSLSTGCFHRLVGGFLPARRLLWTEMWMTSCSRSGFSQPLRRPRAADKTDQSATQPGGSDWAARSTARMCCQANRKTVDGSLGFSRPGGGRCRTVHTARTADRHRTVAVATQCTERRSPMRGDQVTSLAFDDRAGPSDAYSEGPRAVRNFLTCFRLP